jgi:hypothetical protein
MNRQELLNVVPPADTRTYKAVPVSFIIEEIEKNASENNVTLVKENFIVGRKGNQQTMLFHFLTPYSEKFLFEIGVNNSYDKTMSLGAASGASVRICTNGQVSGDLKIWEKHMADVRLDLANFLKTSFSQQQMRIQEAEAFWNVLNSFESSVPDTYSFIGDLFMNDVIDTRQINAFKENFFNDTFQEKYVNEGVKKGSLNMTYQLLTETFQEVHPLNHLKKRKKLEMYFKDIVTPELADGWHC